MLQNPKWVDVCFLGICEANLLWCSQQYLITRNSNDYIYWHFKYFGITAVSNFFEK